MANTWWPLNLLRNRAGQPDPAPPVAPPPGAAVQSAQNPVADTVPFAWIEDEDLLREEGAVYGLAGQGLTEKQDVIKAYYQRQIDAEGISEKSIEKQLELLEGENNTLRKQLDDAKENHEKLTIEHRGEQHRFYRLLLGLLVYLTILGFTFWGVYQWVAPVWDDYPLLVTVGIFLFGSLSLLGNWTLVYHADQKVEAETPREPWKNYLEDYGIPFATALFVGVAGTSHQPWAINLSFSLVVFLVFVFVGKGLFMMILNLGEANKTRQINWRKARQRRAQLRELAAERNQAALALETNQANQAAARQAMKESEQRIKELESTCTAKVAYFASEYELAAAAASERMLHDWLFQVPTAGPTIPPQTTSP